MFSCCICDNHEEEIKIASPETSEEQNLLHLDLPSKDIICQSPLRGPSNTSSPLLSARKHTAGCAPPSPIDDDSPPIVDVAFRAVPLVCHDDVSATHGSIVTHAPRPEISEALSESPPLLDANFNDSSLNKTGTLSSFIPAMPAPHPSPGPPPLAAMPSPDPPPLSALPPTAKSLSSASPDMPPFSPPSPMSVRVPPVPSISPSPLPSTSTTMSFNEISNTVTSSPSRDNVPRSPQFNRQMVRRDMSEPPVPLPARASMTVQEVEDHPFISWMEFQFEPAPQLESARPWTPEEKMKEKERLSKLVRAFVKQAVGGVACTYFDHSSGDKLPAEFTLDKGIKSFGVKVHDKEFAFMMTNLHEVYTWEVMKRTPKLANFMKMKAFSSLSNEERSKLVMLEYIDEKQYLQRVCIFEDKGQQAAEDFINCIKILRLFSVTPSPR